MAQIRLITCLLLITLIALPVPASGWNIPGPMLSAMIAYQVLSLKRPQTIEKVKAVLRETSLVREPMAGSASESARRRTWPRAVYAGSKVGR